MAYLSLDRILNWYVGSQYINDWFPDKQKDPSDGGYPAVGVQAGFLDYYYYPRTLGPSQNISSDNWRSTVDKYEQAVSEADFASASQYNQQLNEWNDYAYTYNNFYGVKQKMDATVGGNAKLKMGTLSYNVGDADNSDEDDYSTTTYENIDYDVFYGNSLEDLDSGESFQLNLYVPNIESSDNYDDDSDLFWESSYLTATTKTEPTTSFGLIQANGGTFTYSSANDYTDTYETSLSRTYGFDAELTYKIEQAVSAGLGQALSSTVTTSWEAEFGIDFSTTADNSFITSYTTSSSETGTYTNDEPYDLMWMLYTVSDYGSCPYALDATLTRDITDVGGIQDYMVSYYKDSSGGASRTQAFKVSDLLSDITTTTNLDDIYDTAINSDAQTLTSSGKYESQAYAGGKLMFYYEDPYKSVDDSCEYTSITTTQDCVNSSSDSDSSNSSSDDLTDSDSSIASARKSTNRFFRWKHLLKLHNVSHVNSYNPVSRTSKGKSESIYVGNKLRTITSGYSIGTDIGDYHLNQSNKPGGAILHGGADRYKGNKKSDFVSSKSVDGYTLIETFKGKDKVYIDLSNRRKFSPGSSDLGHGADKILYRGSTRRIDDELTNRELLTTGNGNDKVFIEGNVKLAIQDFDLLKDRIKFDYPKYDIKMSSTSVVLTNKKGSSIVLYDVFERMSETKGFDVHDLASSNPSLQKMVDDGQDHLSHLHEIARLSLMSSLEIV